MSEIKPRIRSQIDIGLPLGHSHDGEYVVNDLNEFIVRKLTPNEKRLIFGLEGALKEVDEATENLRQAISRLQEFKQSKTLQEMIWLNDSIVVNRDIASEVENV